MSIDRPHPASDQNTDVATAPADQSPPPIPPHDGSAAPAADRAETSPVSGSSGPDNLTPVEQMLRTESARTLAPTTADNADQTTNGPPHPDHTPDEPTPAGPNAPPHSSETQARNADADEQAAGAGASADAEVRRAHDAAAFRAAVLEQMCDRYQVRDPVDIAAVEGAYDTVTKYHAPLVVSAAIDILDDCKAEAAQRPDTVVAFLGRDADSLAVAAEELDPEWASRHTTQATMSRCLADSMIQDLERYAGKQFPQLKKSFRDARDDVDPADVPGARASVTEYLESRGIPVGAPGANITVVDTSFRGTVQELFSAAYPAAHITGKYMFLREADDDPHPGSKTGYITHATSDGPPPTKGSASELFATHKDAVLAIEQILRGPYSKAVRLTDDGALDRHLESPPLHQINPLDVAPRYSSENVRLAIMEGAQLAVGGYARTIAAERRDGADWHTDLAAKTENFARQLRSWVEGDPDTDSDLADLLGSFVRRADKHEVARLRGAIEQRALGPDAATEVWQQFKQLGSLDDKTRFVTDFTTTDTATPGGADTDG